MSSAIAAGFYHSRCKDGHTTYFPGISTPPDDQFTKKELQDVAEQSRREARQQYAECQAESSDRMAKYSLDEDNRQTYRSRANQIQKEYRVVGADGNHASLQERIALKNVISELPDVVKKSLKEITFKIRSNMGSGYMSNEKAVYLSINATKREIIHEVGHVLEEKLFDAKKVTQLKKKITRGLSESDIMVKAALDSAGNKRQIFLLNSDRFIDGYQSRLYIDDISEAVNKDGTINTDALGKFISVAVDYCFTYPRSMKKNFPEMYDLVLEALDNE